MVACRFFGHRYRFRSRGPVMEWTCERGCGVGGSKEYATPAEARHFASAFDRDDRDDRDELGRRAPLLGMFPLRIWYKLRQRSDRP